MSALDVTRYIDAAERANAEAMMYVEYHGYEGPRDGERGHAFRQRIAGRLRADGYIVEAHEVMTGRRWDDPNGPEIGDPRSPLTGIAGAVAQAMRGGDYSRDGESKVGDDIAAGVVVTAPKSAMEEMFDALGPAATLDLIDGMFGR